MKEEKKEKMGGMGFFMGNHWVLLVLIGISYFISWRFWDDSLVVQLLPGLKSMDRAIPFLTEWFSVYFNPISTGLWCIMQVSEAILALVITATIMYKATPKEKIPNPDALRRSLIFMWVIGVVFGVPSALADAWSAWVQFDVLGQGAPVEMPAFVMLFLYGAVTLFLVFGQEALYTLNQEFRKAMMHLSGLEFPGDNDAAAESTAIPAVIEKVSGSRRQSYSEDVQKSLRTAGWQDFSEMEVDDRPQAKEPPADNPFAKSVASLQKKGWVYTGVTS